MQAFYDPSMAERPPPMPIQITIVLSLWLGKIVSWPSCAWALTAHVCESWVLFLSVNHEAHLHLHCHHLVMNHGCPFPSTMISSGHYYPSTWCPGATVVPVGVGSLGAFCSTEASILAGVGHRAFTQHRDGNRMSTDPSLTELPWRLCWALHQE